MSSSMPGKAPFPFSQAFPLHLSFQFYSSITYIHCYHHSFTQSFSNSPFTHINNSCLLIHIISLCQTLENSHALKEICFHLLCPEPYGISSIRASVLRRAEQPESSYTSSLTHSVSLSHSKNRYHPYTVHMLCHTT